ncbi:MAG: hypothetical protein SGILL_008568 [Bacillariaceae sp.]
MIIEGLLETTKETSPTKRKEAMLHWLQLTAAEIMSPTQHDSIVDSARLERRSIAEQIPSPGLYSPKTQASKKTFHDVVNLSTSVPTNEELDKISEQDEAVKDNSSPSLVRRNSSGTPEEDDVVLDSERCLDRSLSKAPKDDACDRSTPSAKPERKTVTKPVRKRSKTKSKETETETENRKETGQLKTSKPKRTRSGTKKNKKGKKTSSPDLRNAGKKVIHEVTEKPFIDKFLDHDLSPDESMSERVVVSPGGTAKTKTRDEVQEYKATLQAEMPIEDSFSKLRITPGFMSSSRRMMLHDSFPRRDEIRKMRSVPNLRVHSDMLVELFVAESKPIPGPPPITPPSASTVRSPKKKKAKKSSKATRSSQKKKKKTVAEKPLASLTDLPRQAPPNVADGRAQMFYFQKSKSLSNLDNRSFNSDDRELLVSRLKSLSMSLGNLSVPVKRTPRNSPAPTRPKKVRSLDKKSKDKATTANTERSVRGEPETRRPKKSLSTEKKRKNKSEQARGISASQSMRNFDTMRPFSLSGDRFAKAMSLTPKQQGKKHNRGSDDEEIIELSATAPPLPPRRKASRDPSLQDWKDISHRTPNPPVQPRRKASRDPSLQDWKNFSQSTPNLSRGKTRGKTIMPKSTRGIGIAEGDILEVPDDTTVCSELTDAHSEYFETIDSPKKKGKKKKLTAITEASPSTSGLSLSDSLTKDTSLHLTRRWDNPRKDANVTSPPPTPRRHNDDDDDDDGTAVKEKKFAWLKKKMKLNYFMKSNLR